MNHATIVTKHRNRLMGEWAAAALRLSGRKAKGYVESLLALGDASPDDLPILSKLEADFHAAAIPEFRSIIRFKMRFLFDAAQHQLRGQGAMSDLGTSPGVPTKAA